MSYWYKKVDCQDYVVSMNAEYNVSVRGEDLTCWEAEDEAFNILIDELQKRDVEEIDPHVVEVIGGFGSYIVKCKVNMVVPCVASSYEEAKDVAESFIDGITWADNVAYIGNGAWDSALADEKSFLLRCKGA